MRTAAITIVAEGIRVAGCNPGADNTFRNGGIWGNGLDALMPSDHDTQLLKDIIKALPKGTLPVNISGDVIIVAPSSLGAYLQVLGALKRTMRAHGIPVRWLTRQPATRL